MKRISIFYKEKDQFNEEEINIYIDDKFITKLNKNAITQILLEDGAHRIAFIGSKNEILASGPVKVPIKWLEQLIDIKEDTSYIFEKPLISTDQAKLIKQQQNQVAPKQNYLLPIIFIIIVVGIVLYILI